MSIYFNNPWRPIKNKIIADLDLQNKIHDIGFQKLDLLNAQVIDELNQLFKDSHKFSQKDGGMFYSVYSQDLEYRLKMHNEIQKRIQPLLDKMFVDFKIMINSFVVKLSGPKSEFYLHQDTTGLDEWKFSPLSLWIPLQDVDENNGCLGVIPKSHRWFSPYRSISFPAPFDGIQNKVKEYLQPLEMKKGEVLIFDNRLLHNSYANISGKSRIAIICGVFPKEADLITCFKPEDEGKVELIKQNDDYLLKGKNFLIDCHKRPESGISIGWKDDNYTAINEKDFEKLCEIYLIDKNTKPKSKLEVNCEMIGEPNNNK